LERPQDVGIAFFGEVRRAARVFGTDYAAVDHKNLGAETFDRFFGTDAWTSISLSNEQRFDREGLRGRLLSRRTRRRRASRAMPR